MPAVPRPNPSPSFAPVCSTCSPATGWSDTSGRAEYEDVRAPAAPMSAVHRSPAMPTLAALAALNRPLSDLHPRHPASTATSSAISHSVSGSSLSASSSASDGLSPIPDPSGVALSFFVDRLAWAAVGAAGWAARLGAALGLTGAAPRSYAGHRALVTGASSGIGACFASELARRGAHLILVARSEDKLRTLATRLSAEHAVQAEVFVTDLAAQQAVPELLERVKARGLQVDILVNNAGFGAYGRAETIEAQQRHAMSQVNMWAAGELALGCLPAMRKANRGTIFNIASIAAFVPMPYMAHYAATKAYLTALSEGLRAENRDRDLRILAVCPGPTRTEFFNTAGMRRPEPLVGALVSAQSVVDAAFCAADKDASYVLCTAADTVKIGVARVTPRTWLATRLERQLRP